MSRYLGLFVSESAEHLEKLSRELVRLEKEAGGSESIDAMFRHAHSVKGMAASMGFEQLATLAHRVEDLVHQIRHDRAVLDAPTADLLLAAVDHLQAMVRAAGAGGPQPDAAALVTRIGERLLQLTGAPLRPTPVVPAIVNPPSSPVPPAAAAPQGPPRFSVEVLVSAACQVPGVRAFLVHKKMSALGNVFDLVPPLDDLKAGRIPENRLSLVLESQVRGGAATVRKALSVVADLEAVEVRELEQKSSHLPPRAPGAAESAKAIGVEGTRTVRVKTEILDYFLDAVGELLLATAQVREAAKELPDGPRRPIDEAVGRLHAVVKDLHDKVMSVRMTPLALITDRLPRAARDLARKKGRELELVVEGMEIELDRAILDELADPLLHLLRNCVDHGIEDPAEREKAGKGPRGRIAVSARRDRDRVLVQIEDDGRGMDPERLKRAAIESGFVTAEAAAVMSPREALLLCCLPGVSTARDVTDISGRGVGMDAVKRATEDIGGTLEIDSAPGRGTRFTLRLPLTVAVVNVLLVEVGDEIVGLPIAKVRAVVQADPAALTRSRNASMLPHNGALVPVHVLGRLMGFDRSPIAGARPHVLVEAEGGEVALEVDRLLGQHEAVFKPAPRPVDLIPGVAGVTILGSGRPIVIVDVPRLLAV